MKRSRMLARGFLAVALMGLAVPAAALEVGAEADWTLGGEPCRLIPVTPAAADAPPIGTGSCPGVRPGAVVESDNGQCTFNFLFTGSDGSRYIGTAGHCILTQDGEQTWAAGSGPQARDGAGTPIGEFAYAVLQDPKDFSLIRLDPNVEADAGMCHFGGPTGTNSDLTSQPTVLHHFGQGLALGQTIPGRTHLATSMPNADHVYADGVAIFGDSGSGVISADGRAVGVLVTIGIHAASVGTSGLDAGTVGITRLQPQIDRAENLLGIQLELVTSPLL